MRVTIISVLLFASANFLFAIGSKESVEQGEDPIHIEVGYMPILPVAQVFLVEQWAQDYGLELKMVRFSDGPSMVQAVASGKLDVMYFGIGPAMVAASRGLPVRVLATATSEQIAFVAHPALGKHFDVNNPEATFAKFAAENGRRPRIATFPPGSVPSIVLHYWLQEILGLDVNESVEIISMGANQVQQALLSQAVEAASILEPILTIVTETTEATVLVQAAEMFPNQPGAVLSVRQQLIDAHPDAVATLVSLHERATKVLVEDPDSAVSQVVKYLGEGLVDPELIRKALKSPLSKSSSSYTSNPHAIFDASQRMYEYQKKEGTIEGDIDFELLFNTSFYDQLEK